VRIVIGLSIILVLAVAVADKSALAVDLSRGIVLDIPDNIAAAQFKQVPISRLTREDSAAISSYRFTADTLKVLAILVRWIDRPNTYSRATFDSMLFSRNVYPGGSVADYYNEVSYGKLVVVGDVREWYTASGYNSGYNFEQLLTELNPVIDFSKYDGDHNGDVDACIFIRSGNGQEDSRDYNDIWSYAMVYQPGGGPGPFDGMMVPRWNTCPETTPLRDPLHPKEFSGLKGPSRVRVFAHELAHNVGLPDLYDYDSKLDTVTYRTPNDANDHPVQDWCAMGYGGYGLFSIGSDIASQLCGWNKKEAKWITPVTLHGGEYHLTINNIETTNINSLFQLPINLSNGEYFLLEYRNPRSTAKFDKFDSDYSCYFWPDMNYGCDSLDRGLMITHVHDSLGASYFRINTRGTMFTHYTVAVEDAGYNPSRNYTTNPGGRVSDRAQWWYPYETQLGAMFSNSTPGQEIFGPTTYPSSDGYYGPTGIFVRVDSIVDDKLYAYVKFDKDGDGIVDSLDNCPSIPNPDQADGDHDGAGDLCDNCPSTPNSNQADIDHDGIGDACDNCVDPDHDGYGSPGYPATTCQIDNCPNVFNPDQRDSNHDGVGDACSSIAAILRDTVATSCMKLIVSNFGNFGYMGALGSGGANLDYSSQGDCEGVYLYDGTPLIAYDSSGTILAKYNFYSKNYFQVRLDGNPTVPTTDSAAFQVFRSGTFVTDNYDIGLEKTWYAPKQTDSCQFVIQCLKLYSFDGLTHTGLRIGEAIDWDIPSSLENTGGYNASAKLIYQKGYGYGCQDNSSRYGGQALIGIGALPGCIDTSATPYGAYTQSNNQYLWATQGFVPTQVYSLMHQPGYSALGTIEDQHTMMTFFDAKTIGPSDTVYIYTALSTVRNGTATNLVGNITKARRWFLNHVRPICSAGCCRNNTGNVDGDPDDIVDISDLSIMVDYLFNSGTLSSCAEENDVDKSGSVDIADLSTLVDFLFFSGSLPACP
jgi:M6 family metalloprotease-like protein